MQIIKDEQIIEDNWHYLEDHETTDNENNIIVSLARWHRDKTELLGIKKKLGVRIGPDDSVKLLADDLKHIELVDLHFPEFADGRLFSQAWLLRSRYRFQGELRASGHYIPDQAFYLSRVGVDTFVPEKAEHLKLLLSYLSDFSVKYQTSII